MKFIIKHFKTVSFFSGFLIDIAFLPKTTSIYYVWIGPIDIGIVLFFIIIRQFIKKNLVKRNKKIKKDFKNNKNEEVKNIEDIKTKGHKRIEKLTGWTTYVVSFFLGTFLSHTLIYYFRSADIIQMWPIFLIIFFAVIANEFLFGTIPDIILFYISLTFYIIFNVPIFLNKVNTETFFYSILISVILSSLITMLIQSIYLSKKELISLIIFSILFPFLILRLYYINYIPAVPLELGDSGFYSKIEKINKDNLIDYTKEKEGFVEKKELFIIDNSFYSFNDLTNKELYFFSSIISPAKLEALISNIWEKYDEEKKIWLFQSGIDYPISGGREDGYRGYSNVKISKGLWRVKVLADGRLVGLKKIVVK